MNISSEDLPEELLIECKKYVRELSSFIVKPSGIEFMFYGFERWEIQELVKGSETYNGLLRVTELIEDYLEKNNAGGNGTFV